MLKFSEIGNHFFVVYARSVWIASFNPSDATKLTIEPASIYPHATTSNTPMTSDIIDLTTLIFTNLFLVVTSPEVYLVDVLTGAMKTP